MLGWLLILVPVAVSVHWLMPEAHTLVFGSAALAIIPLAGWMERATEALAARVGEGVGGLLNATFGNAAELVIALAALRHGLYDAPPPASSPLTRLPFGQTPGPTLQETREHQNGLQKALAA